MEEIIIVEDELKLGQELKKFLESNNYRVKLLNEFSNVLEFLLNNKADIILLDINLPYVDGETICKEFRKNSDTPIIMLTSKNTELDELISINYGADDFITKPYNPQILLARIERLLKRFNKKDNIINYENIKVDINKSIIECDNKYLDLSKNELRILVFLLKNKGKIVSRDEIINYLWDSSDFIDDNTLNVNITRIRYKLKTIGLENVIMIKKGQGYIIL